MSNIKKKKNMEDRISRLPDSLLHRILSSLNTKLVVQTCVLSKRWKTLWTRIPTLNFDYKSYPFEGDFEKKERSFKHFIFRVLSEHRGTHIQKLNYLGYTDEAVLVELLICHAGCRNVQELSINTRHMGFYDWNYYYSTCSSLTSLTMICGFVDDWEALVLPSLKILKIDCGWWEGHRNRKSKGIKMFSCCPNLESLILIDYLFESATICAPKLENLELCASFEWEYLIFPEVELLTPSLKNVYFSHILPTVKPTLEFSCIHKVYIELEDDSDFDFEGMNTNRQKSAENLFELLRVFHKARSFTLPLKEMQFYKVVSSLPSLSGITFHNLKHLKLTTQMTNKVKVIDLPICVLALKCPNLENVRRYR